MTNFDLGQNLLPEEEEVNSYHTALDQLIQTAVSKGKEVNIVREIDRLIDVTTKDEEYP